MTCCGVSVPFFSGCHCAAISETGWPDHSLQRALFDRNILGIHYHSALGRISQPAAMSFLTNPHTLRRLPKETLYGVQFTFFVGCHCAAISGNSVARSFSFGITIRLAQTGHPLPTTRDLTDAFHSCPRLHTHQTAL